MPLYTRLRRATRTTAANPEGKAEGNAVGNEGNEGNDTGNTEAETETNTEAKTEADAAGTAGADAGEEGAAGEKTGKQTLRGRLSALRAAHPRAARAARLLGDLLAGALLVGALLMPNNLGGLRPGGFTRIPAEAIIGVVLLLALPRRPRTVVAALCGAGIGVVTVLNLLDMGFTEYLGRKFNLVLDWGLLDDAQTYVADSMGRTTATAAAVGAILLVPLLIAVMALAAVRLGHLLARHRTRAARGALLAGIVWITCAALGVQAFGTPVASQRAAGALKQQTGRVVDTLRDEAAFAEEARADTFGATPPEQLLPDLRGKDVVFAFIESYGRTALEDPLIAPGVTGDLDAATESLAKAGYRARSGWLTSATYGGSSWLGHSTTLSGLWIDNQQRYRTVTSGDHLTLTKAFQKSGAWDTVGVMPGVQKNWPEADWYGLDTVYDAFELGYKGPKFSWSTMPDQYALEAFQRLEHGKKRDRPLMSEIILTSSHQPWAPVPELVDWDELGDGTVYDAIEEAGKKPADVMADRVESRREYGTSIRYSVASLTQWLQRYGTDDTVLVFLGDHQPIARVSGRKASRDVPVTIVAKDPKVLEKTDRWNWTEGLRPAKDAPVWKMSSFRDRFLTAYGSVPHPTKG